MQLPFLWETNFLFQKSARTSVVAYPSLLHHPKSRNFFLRKSQGKGLINKVLNQTEFSTFPIEKKLHRDNARGGEDVPAKLVEDELSNRLTNLNFSNCLLQQANQVSLHGGSSRFVSLGGL